MRIRLITSVTPALPTAVTPLSTPDAMLPADPVTLSWRPWIALSTWVAETKSLSWIQSWRRCSPATVSEAMSSD